MTAATQLAVFYATDSKILRRKVIPNDEAQLEGLSAGPGESMLLLPLAPMMTRLAGLQLLQQQALGRPADGAVLSTSPGI